MQEVIARIFLKKKFLLLSRFNQASRMNPDCTTLENIEKPKDSNQPFRLTLSYMYDHLDDS
jgi:hypothetical protein